MLDFNIIGVFVVGDVEFFCFGLVVRVEEGFLVLCYVEDEVGVFEGFFERFDVV